MRNKTLGKRIAAWTLAASMVFSALGTGVVPGVSEAIVVQAAEAAETLVWSDSTDKLTFTAGSSDTWTDATYATDITDVTVGTSVKVKAKVTVTGDASGLDGAETSEGSGAYNAIQLASAVKSGSWTYAKSSDYPFLKSTDFTDGVANVEFTYETEEGSLQEILFQYDCNGYTGDIEISDVEVYNVVESNTVKTETQVWSDSTSNLTFTAGTSDTWTDATFATDITDVTVGTSVKVTAKVTVDGDVTGLDGAETSEGSGVYNAIQLASAVKSGSWTYAKSSDYPFLKSTDFTDNVANVEFTYETEEGSLQEILFQYDCNAYTGNIIISDVVVYNVVETTAELEKKDPTVVDDFETEGCETAWTAGGYQYENGITFGRENVNGSNQLKLSLNYAGYATQSWSEAKAVKAYEDGIDVSAYNMLTYELTYPTAFDGYFKAKVFAKNSTSNKTIIDKEATIESTDLGNGWKKALVTVRFKNNTEAITELTLGIVGVNTEFVGDVYIDNITVSQYDAMADFVDITSTVGEATVANTSQMPTSVTLADADATDSTKALYAYLQGLDAADQVLFGHQNDTHKHTGTNDGVYSDTKDVTGSISGVVGIDSLALTGVELGLTDVDEAIAESVRISKEAAAEGAIITLSTHMPNMSDSKIVATPDAKRKYDFSACDFSESKNLANNCSQEVLPGGKYNEQFTTYLDIIADYALALQADGIPVLFRPYHENTGGWFWWGAATTDTETYNALYRYTEDYLASRGVHNIIYVYSPNGPLTSEEEYTKRYPGDDYVDIVAFDYYNDYNTYPGEWSEDFMTSLNTTCQIVKSFADKHGKVAAIAETGVRVMKQDGSDNEGLLVKNNPIKGQNWYQRVSDIAKNNGMPYFLIWANFSDTNFYVPYKNGEKGQELINEFIDYYNDASSLFANGTNFYGAGNASTVAVTNTKTKTAGGYFTNVFSKGVIKENAVLSAKVKNATTVQFVLANGEKSQTLATTLNGDLYQATVTAADLTAVGQTDVGTISLVADGKTLVTLSFMSFGKDKETLAANMVENFELYYGDNDYLNGTYTENSAANCSSEFTLDATNKSSGSYGGSFNYKLKTSGSEVWTGRMKGLDVQDYSAYNALTMWVKPDGKGQKLVVQLVSNGEDFEAFLTDFVATTDAKYITIPFDQLKGKNGGTFDPKSVTKFAIWCNSIPANGATDIESSIVFDDIQFINVDTSTLNIQNGYAITDESLAPVEKEETSIKLNKTTARVKKGKTLQLKATVTPSDMTVTWKSSNTKVATVSKSGKVKGIKQGTATITATATDANGVTVTAKCKITVPYNITYKLNKGTNNKNNPSTYYKETVKLKAPSRKGYAFKGWYTDKNFKKKITKISKSSKKNITVYAKWSKITVKKASIKSVKNSVKKSMKVTVNKVSGATGYEIVYSTNKNFKNKKTTTTTKTSKWVKGLKKGKTYYVKVRAYKKDSAGKKVYGKYSTVKKIKISK